MIINKIINLNGQLLSGVRFDNGFMGESMSIINTNMMIEKINNNIKLLSDVCLDGRRLSEDKDKNKRDRNKNIILGSIDVNNLRGGNA